MKTRNNSLIIVLNSLVYFLLAYFTVILLSNGFILFLLQLNGTEASLHHYGISLKNAGDFWPDDLKILIFVIGIGFSFLLGIVFERIYKSIRKRPHHIKLFFLWAYLISFTVFFGNIIVGSFFYYGPGVVFEQFGFPNIIKVFIALVAAAAFSLVGIYSNRHILISMSIYRKIIHQRDFYQVITEQIILPFLLGNLLVFLLKYPHQSDFHYLDTVVLFTMFIPMIAVIFSIRQQASIRFKRKSDKISLYILPIILLALVMLVYRFALS